MNESDSLCALQSALQSGAPRQTLALSFEDTPVRLLLIDSGRPGPTVWLEAALHGDENDATAALLRLSSQLPSQLHAGRVILLPTANPSAYWTGRMASPKDGKNLNRQGHAAEDSFSPRYFSWLAHLIANTSQYFVDLHGGGWYLDVCPFAIVPRANPELAEQREKMLEGLSLSYLLQSDSRVNLVGFLSEKGVAGILLENGGGSALREESIQGHADNVLRVLHNLGMVKNAPAPAPRPTVLRSAVDLYFPEDGMLLNYQKAGSILQKGKPALTYAAANTLEQKEILCPVDNGVLLSMHTSSLIKKGAYAAYIGYNTTQKP